MMERVRLPNAAISQMSVVFLLTIIPPLIARADGAHVRLLLLFIPEWLAMGWVLVPMFRSPFEMSDVRGKGACTCPKAAHPTTFPRVARPWSAFTPPPPRRIPVLLALLYWCWECGKSLRHWNRFCLCHPGAWRNRFNHDGWPALFFISMVSPQADAPFLLRRAPGADGQPLQASVFPLLPAFIPYPLPHFPCPHHPLPPMHGAGCVFVCACASHRRTLLFPA